MPHGTRRRIVRALKSLKGKQLANPWKKHDNIPLSRRLRAGGAQQVKVATTASPLTALPAKPPPPEAMSPLFSVIG